MICQARSRATVSWYPVAIAGRSSARPSFTCDAISGERGSPSSPEGNVGRFNSVNRRWIREAHALVLPEVHAEISQAFSMLAPVSAIASGVPATGLLALPSGRAG